MAVYCVNIGIEIYRDFSGEITVNTIIKKWIFIWVECTEKKIVSLCWNTDTLSMTLIHCHFDMIIRVPPGMLVYLKLWKTNYKMPKTRQFALLKACVQERALSNRNYLVEDF